MLTDIAQLVMYYLDLATLTLRKWRPFARPCVCVCVCERVCGLVSYTGVCVCVYRYVFVA